MIEKPDLGDYLVDDDFRELYLIKVDPIKVWIKWSKGEGEGENIENYDLCWEKVPKQLYHARKKLEYDCDCGCYASPGQRRSYFGLTDQNILMVDEQYINYESTENIYYLFNNKSNSWSKINLNNFETYCLSCDIETLIKDIEFETYRVGVPVLKILAGIVAIAAAVPSGGASLTVLQSLGVSFGVISGSYATVAGTVELTMVLSNKDELVKKIPSGYLNATIGVTIECLNKDNKSVKIIKGILDIFENATSIIHLPQNSLDLINFSNSTINVTNSIYEIIKINYGEVVPGEKK